MALLKNKLPEDKWFYFRNGRRASNIQELKDVLESMDEFEFKHHVNNERNDFANWVEGVFEKKKLAKNLREVSERDGMVIMLEDFLKKEKMAVGEEAEEDDNHEPAEEEQLVEEKSEEENAGEEKEDDRDDKEEKEEPAEPESESRLIIPPGRKPKLDSEKELSEHEIKNMVAEAKQVFEKQIEKQQKHRLFASSREAEIKHPEHHKFIVAEFIYGFILGLIFGLIMLGVLFNLRFT